MQNASSLDDEAPNLEAILKVLKRENITTIHTTELTKKEYCGIFPSLVHYGETPQAENAKTIKNSKKTTLAT